jgi:Ca-activated chloride channel family protein
MSDYTSFVAVDASERTDGSYGVTVQQAVPVPDGVRYDTTVNE